MPEINPEELRATAQQLRLAIDYADKASEYSTEADPDAWMWGVAGIPMSMIYFPLADGWRDLLSKTGQAIDGVATRLEDTSGGWEDIDSTLSKDFATVLTDLTGAVNEYNADTQNTPLVQK